MILRNFLYLNEQVLDGYLSAIEGYIPKKITQVSKEIDTKKAGVSTSIKVVKGELGKNKTDEVETQMELEITPASKVQKLFDYMSGTSDIPFYEYMESESWAKLRRDELVEFMGSIRFSKLKEISNAVAELERLSSLFQDFSETPLIDSKTQKSLQGLKNLNGLQKGNEIPCVLTFSNLKEYQVVCYLDESCFRVSLDSFIGDVTILCKIQKKIEKGNSVQLTDIFKSFRELPLNREQRRAMPKKKELETPKEFADVIKGPAFVVTPIAIYN